MRLNTNNNIGVSLNGWFSNYELLSNEAEPSHIRRQLAKADKYTGMVKRAGNDRLDNLGAFLSTIIRKAPHLAHYFIRLIKREIK